MAKLLCLAVCLFSTVAISLAQAPDVELPVCNDEFARFLVDQQVSESRSVTQTDKRIYILIRSADFLWKFDQPTAREHFTEAYKVANERFHEKGFERKEDKRVFTLLPDYRFEVVRAIAKHDPEWSKKLIEQIMKEYEKEAADRKDKEFNSTRELYELLRVAEENVKTNPELSRYLFRRAMQHPLDYHWFWVLYGVGGQNRQLADDLYEALLINYANAGPRRLLFLSAYPSASPRILGIEKYAYGATVPETLTANQILQRRFIETFLRGVAAYAANPQNLNLSPEENRLPEPVYMISALNELEPIIIRQFPALLQRFTEAKAQATAMLTEQMLKDLGIRESRNESLGFGFERRLKELEKADADGKLTDEMIISLLTWGEGSKTEENFKQIEPWLAKIKDENARSESINYFWFLRARLAVKDNRLDDAERFAKKIPEIEHRAVLLLEIAEAQLKNVNNAATVYQTLRDVGRLAEQSETSVEKARVILSLASQYIKINPVFAMQELSDAIGVINQLENSDAILSTTVRRQINTKNSSFFASFSLPGSNLERSFTDISKDSFELSLSNAKSLEDKYLRTLAVLAVAKNCVDRPKKTPPTKKAAN